MGELERVVIIVHLENLKKEVKSQFMNHLSVLRIVLKKMKTGRQGLVLQRIMINVVVVKAPLVNLPN